MQRPISRTVPTSQRHAPPAPTARDSDRDKRPHQPSPFQTRNPASKRCQEPPAASPQAGAGFGFENTPQTGAAPCPQLRRSRTRRRTWSRTFSKPSPAPAGRHYRFLTPIARMAFRMAMIATPTSPKTASHMLAMPSAASTRISSLIPSAKMMFCQTIDIVLRATLIA